MQEFESRDQIQAGFYEVAQTLQSASRPIAMALTLEAAARLPNNLLADAYCGYQQRRGEREPLEAAVSLSSHLGNLLRNPKVSKIALPNDEGPHPYFLNLRRTLKKQLSKRDYAMLGNMSHAPFPWLGYFIHLHTTRLEQQVSLEKATKALLDAWRWYNAVVRPVLKHRPIEIKTARPLPAAYAQVMDGVKPCKS